MLDNFSIDDISKQKHLLRVNIIVPISHMKTFLYKKKRRPTTHMDDPGWDLKAATGSTFYTEICSHQNKLI